MELSRYYRGGHITCSTFLSDRSTGYGWYSRVWDTWCPSNLSIWWVDSPCHSRLVTPALTPHVWTLMTCCWTWDVSTGMWWCGDLWTMAGVMFSLDHWSQVIGHGSPCVMAIGSCVVFDQWTVGGVIFSLSDRVRTTLMSAWFIEKQLRWLIEGSLNRID